MGVFGECGQGKSTFLTKVSKTYHEEHDRHGIPLVFTASKSLKAITNFVRIAKSGNMTLIDTPGFNDPNKTRTDKHIFMDLINTIREPLKSPD